MQTEQSQEAAQQYEETDNRPGIEKNDNESGKKQKSKRFTKSNSLLKEEKLNKFKV